MKRDAYFSIGDDHRYRYWLSRTWGSNTRNVLPIVGLNPSDADEKKDDPTIRRCIHFAKHRNYDGFIILNLFALVSRKPKKLFDDHDPIGPMNDRILQKFLSDKKEVWVCWGASKRPKGREAFVLSLIDNPICLGMTKERHPKHPLMLPNSTEFQSYTKNT